MLCSDEENLSAQERENITAFWQGVIQSLNEPLSEAPIGDEYCWMHTPGGWDCLTCYQEHSSKTEQERAFLKGGMMGVDPDGKVIPAKVGWFTKRCSREGCKEVAIARCIRCNKTLCYSHAHDYDFEGKQSICIRCKYRM